MNRKLTTSLKVLFVFIVVFGIIIPIALKYNKLVESETTEIIITSKNGSTVILRASINVSIGFENPPDWYIYYSHGVDWHWCGFALDNYEDLDNLSVTFEIIKNMDIGYYTLVFVHALFPEEDDLVYMGMIDDMANHDKPYYFKYTIDGAYGVFLLLILSESGWE